jgi:AbrB family looped-hinge helix DNA binding protein
LVLETISELDFYTVIRMQYTTTLPLQSGGRVTIPEHIRKKLDVKDGDLVVIIVTTPGGE